jgi:hypothetical protein
MALRPFSRNPKPDDQGESAEPPSNEVEQFFSAELRRQGNAPTDEPEAPADTPAPAISVKDPGDAGWYPDATDPGLMRYWDGFHLTGQILHVHSRAEDGAAGAAEEGVRKPEASEPVPAVEAKAGAGADAALPPPSLTLVGPGEESAPMVPESDRRSNTLNETGGADSEPAEAPDDRSDTVPDSGSERSEINDGRRPVPTPAPPAARAPAPEGVGEPSRWAKKAEQAVARAVAAGTPESWKEAADVAAVVSQMAQTLQVAARAEQEANGMAAEAQEAAQRAQVAAQKSADANRTVQQAQQAAEDADAAAKRARQAAADAQEAAKRASQVVPTFIETEKAAAQVAAEAQRKAQRLAEIVGRAKQADTPEAWSEALRLSSATVGDRPATATMQTLPKMQATTEATAGR